MRVLIATDGSPEATAAVAQLAACCAKKKMSS